MDERDRVATVDAQLAHLLQGAARGDDDAVVALYPLVTDRYRRYARRCGLDPEDVEDVASEAFVALLEALRGMNPSSVNEEWKVDAHVRRAVNRRRGRREYGIDPETVLASAVLPVDDWEEARKEADRLDAEAEEEERRRSVLRRAIESSRPYPRRYLSLRLLDGRLPREISGITGEPRVRVTRRIRSLTANLKNRLQGRPPRRARGGAPSPASCGAAGSTRAAIPAPSTIRVLVEEFCSENPDGSAEECLGFIADATGCQLARPRFYTDYWVCRRAAAARGGKGRDEVPPPRAYDDFRLKDGQLRPASLLTRGMRAQIQAFVLVLREDDPGVSAREAMRKAGEHHGVLFRDIHSFRALYFSPRGYGHRSGRGSGGLRALKGHTPDEVHDFVEQVLRRNPGATARDVLRATNLGLGTAIKAEGPFRARYVAPARRRLGLPGPPPPARGTWNPPAPPEGWRAPGTLSREERNGVVAWLREQLLADEDLSGAELWRGAREVFKVDWRGEARFARAYLWRARKAPEEDVPIRRTSAEAGKRIIEFVRVRLDEDASLVASHLMRMVNRWFGTGFSCPTSFRQRYVAPVRNELRNGAGSSALSSPLLEPRMATTPPAATPSSRFAPRSSLYTPEQKALALDWLVQYITANPLCTIEESRVEVQDALRIRIAKGTFHTGFFGKAVQRCAPEIHALRGKRSSGSAPRSTRPASLTDRQKARIRQAVACLKRDHPELLLDLPALMARALALDGVHYNDVVAFRQHYVDPVAPAAPGDPYPEPLPTVQAAAVPVREAASAPAAPSRRRSTPAPATARPEAEIATMAQEPTAPAVPPTITIAPLPANILSVLAADPVRAIRLEGVEGTPGRARILMDIGPLAMADAARLYATIYTAVADVLS